MKYSKKFFRALLLFIGLIVIFIIDGIINDKIPRNQFTNYGAIYGNKVKLNGEPSERLKARLNTGILLYNLGKLDKIIVSGGIGKEGFDEGKVMKSYLVKNGVEEINIIVDSSGYTTRKTAINISKLIQDKSSVNIIGISQFYHIPRLKLSLKQAGFNNIFGYSPYFFELRDFYSTIRELPAYIKYFLT